MKWDIDKALKALEGEGVPGTIFSRTLLYDADTIRRANIKGSEEEVKHGVVVWTLGIGRAQTPKFFVYGRTIRTAYLQARRIIKGMSPQAREAYGIKAPKKGANSFASARRKRK